MINIVFEGSTGTGKTTIIEKLYYYFNSIGIKTGKTKDLDSSSPLYPVLNKLFKDSPLISSNLKFNTIISESLIQAADYQYLKEKTYSENNIINLFDRAFFSIEAYQKVLLQNIGEPNNTFIRYLSKCARYKSKTIDIIFYMNESVNLSLERSQNRDKRTFSEEEKAIFKKFNKQLKKNICYYCKNNITKLVYVDANNLDERYEIIKEYIEKYLYHYNKGENLNEFMG